MLKYEARLGPTFNVQTLGQLAELSELEVRSTPGYGPSMARELRRVLRSAGLDFAPVPAISARAPSWTAAPPTKRGWFWTRTARSRPIPAFHVGGGKWLLVRSAPREHWPVRLDPPR